MTDRPDSVVATDEGRRDPGVVKWIVIGLGALGAVVLIVFLIALFGGLSRSEGIADMFRIMRDFFIIVLALQGILISVALVVLILQLTALINLVRTEIKPIIDETRQTLTTVRGTAQFVSQNVAAPMIGMASALAGARAFVGELMNIRRNLRGVRGGHGTESVKKG